LNCDHSMHNGDDLASEVVDYHVARDDGFVPMSSR
jgi:hypothetical protein